MSSTADKTKTGRTPRDAVRGAILETVERLLAGGESFTSLGVRRITEEAGVARSAFYTNFSDKRDLLMALTGSATEEIFRASAEWIASDPKDGVESLAHTQMRSIAVFRRHAPVVAAYTEVAAYDAEVAGFWSSRMDGLVEALEERIADGQADGVIRANLAPRSTATFIVWGAERTMVHHVSIDDGSGDEALARETAEAVWSLLYG